MSQLLLEVLRDDLPADLDVTTDESLGRIAQEYLSTLLTNDDLFSLDNHVSGPPVDIKTLPNRQDSTKPTILEEIAELDLQEHTINSQLAALTYKHKDLIIDVGHEVDMIGGEGVLQLMKEVDQLASATQQLSELGSREQAPSSSTITAESSLESSTTTTTTTTNSTTLVAVPAKLYTQIESNRSILANIDSVLDMLEIPTLCKLCILQGNYQESLEILTMVQSLLIRFPSINIFKTVNRQVEQELQMMVKGLVRLLGGNLKQGNILKVFQILIKVGGVGSPALDESTVEPSTTSLSVLKLIYLNSRFHFISSSLDTLKPLIKFNRLTYLKRFIETYREHIFNTLSVYHSIFDPLTDSNDPLNERSSDSLVIAQFIKSLVALLTDALLEHYPRLGDAEDASDPTVEISRQAHQDGVVLQILYLCKSLAKYHVDFETAVVWAVCYDKELISEADWMRNLKKVKRFR